jgi:hypothetical protein
MVGNHRPRRSYLGDGRCYIIPGIRNVVYLEPYPKSYASDLHSHAISVDSDSLADRVAFHTFLEYHPSDIATFLSDDAAKTPPAWRSLGNEAKLSLSSMCSSRVTLRPNVMSFGSSARS